MAAGNMLLGYARGSVGDVTFQRLKGQQITKARNRKPNNPKTEKQQLQRAKFSGALLFHKQLVSRFFKFAYEDKTERESDFNAFMRHNTRIAPLIFKQSTRNDEYPVFAPFQVSQGSLPEISIKLGATNSNLFFNVEDWAGANLNNDSTIGELSSYLINLNPDRWRQGDIITFLIYGALENGFVAPPAPEYAFECQQVIKQFIIDTSSTQKMSEYFYSENFNAFIPTREDDEYIPFYTNDGIAVTVIHSRNVSGSLQVSTQSLVLSDKAQEVYESSNYYTASAAFIQEILTSWEAADIAILQGALAKGTSTNFSVHKLSIQVSGTETQVTATEGGIYKIESSNLPANSLINLYINTSKAITSRNVTTTPNLGNLSIENVQGDWETTSNSFTGKVYIQIEYATISTGLHIVQIANQGQILIQITA